LTCSVTEVSLASSGQKSNGLGLDVFVGGRFGLKGVDVAADGLEVEVDVCGFDFAVAVGLDVFNNLQAVTGVNDA
jgi:hypothetical protein